MHVSADFTNPQSCKINVNLCSKGQNWEEHELSLSVDWENTPRRVLMSIARCWTPSRLLYTNGRFIPGLTWRLGAHFHSWHLRPAHMVSSQMTRGYPVEPTVASEPSQLLKLQVCLRSTAQASLGPKMQGAYVSLSGLKTHRREQLSPASLAVFVSAPRFWICHLGLGWLHKISSHVNLSSGDDPFMISIYNWPRRDRPLINCI